MNLTERLGTEPDATARGQQDPVSALRRRARQALFASMGPDLSRPSDDRTLRAEVTRRLATIVAREEHLLSAAERGDIVRAVTDDLLGFGPIQSLLEDPTVTEIMVNAPRAVYVERGGRIEPGGVEFDDEEHIRSIIERIVAAVGRRVDDASPMVDARLPDGSRVNVVLPPLAIGSPTLTIRKFGEVALDGDALVALGTLTPDVAAFLRACVEARCNILISGGTGSGKTTLLNALSSFVPARERIITIEDTAELQLGQPHVVRMESRRPNVEGVGEVTIRDLVRNALRMRPDRIVVGECRGAEALDMLQAMNTGHEGSLTTLHANGAGAALRRLETMVLLAGADLPHRAIREQVAEAIHLVVQLERLPDGSRRVTEIAEIVGLAADATIDVAGIFTFDWSAGVDGDGRFRGSLRSTGTEPAILRRLRRRGIALPVGMFVGEPEPAVR